MELVENDFIARLRTFVRKRVPSSSDADDIVQTVLLRLLEFGRKQSLSSPNAWLLAAARTAIADHHRARARSAEELLDATAIPSSQSDDASDIVRCLVPLLAELPHEDRALLQRVEMEGQPQAQLAREIGLSDSGLKSRVRRARARLRKALLARCIFERDAQGAPVGRATCRPGSSRDRCACPREDPDERGC
jgi:RNA polymerase sigma-70 factor (ECF subfamily)